MGASSYICNIEYFRLLIWADFFKVAASLYVDKMNHVLKDCESKAVQQQMLTYGNPSLPVNSALIASVSTFVKKLK